MTPAVRTLIRESKIHQIYSLIQSGGRYHMHTMNHALEQAVKAKRITREVALAHSNAPEALAAIL
jgi:twitching motility protein PilT